MLLLRIPLLGGGSDSCSPRRRGVHTVTVVAACAAAIVRIGNGDDARFEISCEDIAQRGKFRCRCMRCVPGRSHVLVTVGAVGRRVTHLWIMVVALLVLLLLLPREDRR